MTTTFNKAIFAGLVSGVVAALSYLSPVIDDGLASSEILWAVALFLAGTGIIGGGTYGIRNAKSADPTTSTPGPNRFINNTAGSPTSNPVVLYDHGGELPRGHAGHNDDGDDPVGERV